MRRSFLFVVVGALTHLFLVPSLPLEVRALAALVICVCVPGALLVEALLTPSPAPPEPIEQIVYAVGAGFGLAVAGMLFLSFLPGPLVAWQILTFFDAASLLCLFIVWRRTRDLPINPETVSPQGAQIDRENPFAALYAYPAPVSRGWLGVGLVILLLIGGALRFGSLGYAEFLTDEARVVLRAAAVLQGYEDVLFIHRKGPAEILLPALVFSLTGQLNEAVARLPFAVASLTALLAAFLLGWRMLGAKAGWIGAFLLAFDGYLIGFAHFVQFQSVVVLTAVLTALVLYRLARVSAAAPMYLAWAAFFWTTGMLSHYDGLLIVAPAVVLLIPFVQRAGWRSSLRSALPAFALATGLLAAFYLPFVLHPQFQATTSYLVERRISGPGFPYNNLADVLRRSAVYNSTYFVASMALLLFGALGLSYWKTLAGRPGRLVAVAAPLLLAVVVIVSLIRPDWLRIAGVDVAVGFFLLCLLPLWFLAGMETGERALWVWLGAPLLIALFFVAFPRTHVYTYVIPSALLCGMTAAAILNWLERALGAPMSRLVGVSAAVAAAVIFGWYLYRYFLDTSVEVLRTWPADRPALYWQPQDVSAVDAVYGFPLANGWKAVGALYAQGALAGGYESNQRDDLITYWYTRGADRCRATAENYFAIDTVEPWAQSPQAIIDQITPDGFRLWGQVQNGDNPALSIFRRDDDQGEPRTFPLEEYAAAFDALATPDLPLDDPVIQPAIANPLHVNFGDSIWLEGYELSQPESLHPGDTLHLRLFWRARELLDKSYKVFNQAYYGEGVMVAQRDGYPVCDRRPTPQWYPGELIVDDYAIPIAGDAPPGVYPLYTGLYTDDTFERLSVLDEGGNPVDNQVHLADIKIEQGGTTP